ncbi:MAG TPA: TetR/AcrR family transcriptional regulator [Acidimicrobiales bacterium]|nr:TetR/AcrR family transcriptional regulator [Acidimicrobiales bacterium]
MTPTPAGATPVAGSRPDAPQRRSRARRGEGDRLREEILAAAERLLVETGDEAALSIRAIASAVGVTPPSIYLHFTGRTDLLFAVCERHWAQLSAAMDAAAGGVEDPVERLRRRGEAYVRFGLEHPEHYRVLMMRRPDQTPDRFTDERLASTAGLEVVAADLSAAMEAGRFPRQDPMEAAVLLWMAVHGMVSLLISKPDFPFPPPKQLFDHLYRMTLAGFGGPAS